MNQGYPRLLGDIGGTHARWGGRSKRAAPLRPRRYSPVQTTLISRHRRGITCRRRGWPPRWAGLGVATAITGDIVRMTNNQWVFSIDALQSALGLERCRVVNDFTALALSLPGLQAQDLRSVGGNAP